MAQTEEAAAAWGMLIHGWRAGGPEAKSNYVDTFQASAGIWLRSCPLTFHWPKQTSQPAQYP